MLDDVEAARIKKAFSKLPSIWKGRVSFLSLTHFKTGNWNLDLDSDLLELGVYIARGWGGWLGSSSASISIRTSVFLAWTPSLWVQENSIIIHSPRMYLLSTAMLSTVLFQMGDGAQSTFSSCSNGEDRH